MLEMMMTFTTGIFEQYMDWTGYIDDDAMSAA